MVEPSALIRLRIKELTTLKERVERKIRLKKAPKRIRRIAGIDIVLTPEAHKVHVCACLTSVANLEAVEEATATDELDDTLMKSLGNLSLVPLILSVLKMLKNTPDLIMIRELSARDEIPLASYVGVISGKPSIGLSEKSPVLKTMAKWEGIKRAGPVKLRGHKTRLGVIAGHLVTFRDAASLVKATVTDSRVPEPVREAGLRVRAWEREWRRVNLSRK
jgi:deoxyinosine 3'endonuclease (endonuclease V)